MSILSSVDGIVTFSRERGGGKEERRRMAGGKGRAHRTGSRTTRLAERPYASVSTSTLRFVELNLNEFELPQLNHLTLRHSKVRASGVPQLYARGTRESVFLIVKHMSPPMRLYLCTISHL